MKLPTLIQRPSAFVPVVMSVSALILVLDYVAVFGLIRAADEGAIAHLWQLLIAGQVPLLVFFATKWLPRVRRSALSVVALQAVALFAALSPVYFFNR